MMCDEMIETCMILESVLGLLLISGDQVAPSAWKDLMQVTWVVFESNLQNLHMIQQSKYILHRQSVILETSFPMWQLPPFYFKKT
jgi:hypothetical protein